MPEGSRGDWRNFEIEYLDCLPEILKPNSSFDFAKYTNLSVEGVNSPHMFLASAFSIFELHFEDEEGIGISVGLSPPSAVLQSLNLKSEDCHKKWIFVKGHQEQTATDFTYVYKKVLQILSNASRTEKSI
jgi:hypothetical protein